MPCKNPPPCGKNYNQYRLASGVHCCRKKPVSKKRLGNLPAHVGTLISKHLSPMNKRRLALATSKLETLREVRENVQREKEKALRKHLRGLYAGSRIIGRHVVRERRLNNEVNSNFNHLNPYSPYLNLYRWINVMKNKRVPKTGRRVTSPLTNNNINQIKKNILRTMKPLEIGEDMFIKMAGNKFSSKNGTAVLHINRDENTNINNPILKMYIEKRQTPKTVAVYRIVPRENGINNHVTFLPIANYHEKTISNLGFVTVKGGEAPKKKRVKKSPNKRIETYF
jgi:hypothetical protein